MVLRLNRPERLNALSPDLLTALAAALADVATVGGVRAVIITGSGRAFSAGADIRYMEQASPAACRAYLGQAQTVLTTIEALALPVLAAVNGICTGGGNALANACDLRIAAVSARFGEPEGKLGLPGGFGNIPRLVRVVGLSRAAELLLTARLISADDAYRIGLVGEVVADDDLLARALEITAAVAQLGPVAVTQMKRMLHDHADAADEIDAFVACCECGEGREGLRAFIEKRAPQW